MLPSPSTPRSTRRGNERFDHIIREKVAADHPHDPHTWDFKGATPDSVFAPSFGEGYEKRQQQPFWRKALMALRERRNRIAATNTAADYEDPPNHERLGGVRFRQKYSPSLSVWRIARKIGLVFLAMLASILCFFGIVHIVNILINLGPIFYQDETYDIPSRLSNSGYDSPSDVTRDIQPLPCHSHNDYWRRLPLFEAISYGCVGVEADVWLFPDSSSEPELYVGHNTAALTPERTFRSLYVDPITELLDRTNSPASRSISHESAPVRPNGIWDTDPSQTLVLLVDFKNDGESIWPIVQDHLEPLRSRGYLTYWDGKNTVEGPVTVVATGNAPFDLLNSNSTYRDIFYDAPLDMLFEEPEPIPGISPSQHELSYLITTSSSKESTQLPSGPNADSFNSSNSYYASVSYPKSVGRAHWLNGEPTAHQLHLVRGQIRGAKRRGLKPRYWGTPNWPIAIRNKMWEVLVEEGVSFLNVDDLQAATTWDWETRRHRTWFWR
ncbi:Altered inheritance of mitochondria protein 6-like protein [Lasiodiplodia hormozganensis]|uniref:Altered inheritance of mitochondria protein 6 n=1 Tax=Lasiodiplodia hormozganensis TaxID=869390 RepID=A0AA39Z5Z9_9PEZI|nr:Altered inheritance of mitochondria protein 6-like protein [Lasiodiplodia hormozganensis]